MSKRDKEQKGARSKGALQTIQDLNVLWYNTGNIILYSLIPVLY